MERLTTKLEEAIEHEREVAERNRKQYKNCPSDRTDIRHQTCEECAEEHEQLAEWLEELKDYRYKNKMVVRIDCVNLEEFNDLSVKLAKEQYNKAIDDFMKRIDEEMPCDICDGAEALFYVEDIAKQLKAGESE